MARGATGEFSLEGHWASEGDGRGHAVFNAEGIRCANCARSIHGGLDALSGVIETDVNVVNGRVSVTWETARTSLGAILRTVASLGFRPVPLAGEAAGAIRREERRMALKRIGLAGLGSMQVMMYAAGLYTGAFQGIDPQVAEFLKLTCLLIATPVLLYSGAPILRGGLHDLRRRTLGMDVTVSLALLLAYGASVFNTLRGHGEVYFDSVTMFIFFLLLGRWFEMKGRHQAANVTDALARALPTVASRIVAATGALEKIPLADVRAGDCLRVGSGQVIPVDGRVRSAAATVDESLVTGESIARRRLAGESLLGGSLNVGAAVDLEVTAAPHESTLHSLVRMLEHAQAQRPRLGLAAERMASWFVVRILLLTAAVGLAWLFFDPSRAFPAVLAVLVATCPCALSLATPVAIAAATSRLARLGVLVTRSDAIEGLAHIDTVVLDKTGTLTSGAARVLEARTGELLDSAGALAIAAALEQHSRHPLAAAFEPHAREGLGSADAIEIAGCGVEGSVAGKRWRIGSVDWAGALAADQTLPATLDSPLARWLPSASAALGDEQGLQAVFTLSDELRSDAASTIGALRELGLQLQIASGDRQVSVQRVAHELGLADARAQMRPEDKLDLLRELQQEGHRVLMIGDGINDGPVLAAADVSMAMGNGSSIAHAAGDLVLLRESLAALPEAVDVARRALAIVRQNLRWAAAYNMAAIPLAALGLMPPWVAAIGMSMSSLGVVMNARRIARDRHTISRSRAEPTRTRSAAGSSTEGEVATSGAPQ